MREREKGREREREGRKITCVGVKMSMWKFKKKNLKMLIPFSYSELLDSYHSKNLSFNFFAVVCVFNVFVAKMTKPCCECAF